ncbi:MAG: polyphosphate kinase 1 [Planctomycetaceae bacterium]
MKPEYINRELSWLDFNLRVLEEAQDESIPALERLKFLSITASNLDEFFMVRVGGLETARRRGSDKIDPARLSVSEQLAKISTAVHNINAAQYDCFLAQLEPELAKAKIKRVTPATLAESQAPVVEHVFNDQIQSVLTPMAVGKTRGFPLLLSGTLNVCVRLAPDKDESEPRFAVIPFGRSTLRFVTLPSAGGYEYMLAEDVVTHFVQGFFPGEEVVSTALFRMTRNADFSVNEDAAADFLEELEEVLTQRSDSFCVRLELSSNPCPLIKAFLQSALDVGDSRTFECAGPLDLAGFSRLAELPGFNKLRYEDWSSKRSASVDSQQSLFEQIKENDLLLHHPYESFQTLVRFVEEAAADPDVVSIKQTLYRTSRRSPIVNALMDASQSGKQVTVLVELKARFDEERNISWARRLEQAGVQVIYGVKSLKTHAKVCAVVRREPQGFQRYVHFGTGNYNEITSRFYTDMSFFTAKDSYGADALACFNAVCGYSQPQDFRKIEIAPIGMRRRLLEMIHVERSRCEQGHPAKIMAKLNSLVDPTIIKALYEASQAGVEIQLNIRGICCLKPGVPGLSENITVISIIDRYLEHARVLYFLHGGDERVFISSADWMPRNLDRRVEMLVPIEDSQCKRKVIDALNLWMSDTAKARYLGSDSGWSRPKNRDIRCQADFQAQATNAAKAADEARRTVFVPHRSPEG